MLRSSKSSLLNQIRLDLFKIPPLLYLPNTSQLHSIESTILVCPMLFIYYARWLELTWPYSIGWAMSTYRSVAVELIIKENSWDGSMKIWHSIGSLKWFWRVRPLLQKRLIKLFTTNVKIGNTPFLIKF